jgi:hypothetical protein
MDRYWINPKYLNQESNEEEVQALVRKIKNLQNKVYSIPNNKESAYDYYERLARERK